MIPAGGAGNIHIAFPRRLDLDVFRVQRQDCVKAITSDTSPTRSSVGRELVVTCAAKQFAREVAMVGLPPRV
jgi:hypothetical protein